jgi:hypothetical protein
MLCLRLTFNTVHFDQGTLVISTVAEKSDPKGHPERSRGISPQPNRVLSTKPQVPIETKNPTVQPTLVNFPVSHPLPVKGDKKMKKYSNLLNGLGFLLLVFLAYKLKADTISIFIESSTIAPL